MGEEKRKSQGIEKRRAKRVIHHYVIRFKQANPLLPSGGWELSTVRNISKTGICFFASRHYEVGVELEIKLKNPLLPQEERCWAKVVRSRSSEKKRGFYEIAVDIVRVEAREVFNKSIEFFIKRESQQIDKSKIPPQKQKPPYI